jgi:hypothetical protein
VVKKTIVLAWQRVEDKTLVWAGGDIEAVAVAGVDFASCPKKPAKPCHRSIVDHAAAAADNDTKALGMGGNRGEEVQREAVEPWDNRDDSNAEVKHVQLVNKQPVAACPLPYHSSRHDYKAFERLLSEAVVRWVGPWIFQPVAYWKEVNYMLLFWPTLVAPPSSWLSFSAVSPWRVGSETRSGCSAPTYLGRLIAVFEVYYLEMVSP